MCEVNDHQPVPMLFVQLLSTQFSLLGIQPCKLSDSSWVCLSKWKCKNARCIFRLSVYLKWCLEHVSKNHVSLGPMQWQSPIGLKTMVIIIPNPHNALLFSGNPLKIAIDLFVKLDSPPKWVSFNDPCEEYIYLEPQTTSINWMFFETTISHVKVWNHPIETTIYKCLFGLPGRMVDFSPNFSLVVTTGGLQSFLLGPWFLRTHEHHIDHHGSFFHLRRLVGVTRGDLVKIAPP